MQRPPKASSRISPRPVPGTTGPVTRPPGTLPASNSSNAPHAPGTVATGGGAPGTTNSYGKRGSGTVC